MKYRLALYVENIKNNIYKYSEINKVILNKYNGY